MRHWWIGNPVFSAPWDITYPNNSSFLTHWGFHCEYLLMVYPWLVLGTQPSITLDLQQQIPFTVGKPGAKPKSISLKSVVFTRGHFRDDFKGVSWLKENPKHWLWKKGISSSEMGFSQHNSQTSPQSPAENAILVFQRIHTTKVILGFIHINSWKNEGQNEH